MKYWYETQGMDSDVVVYTKLTLSRNIKGYPFPCRLTPENLSKLNELITNTLKAFDEIENDYDLIEIEKLPYCAALSLAERGMVSYKFISDTANKLLFLSKDETVSIMICGEDHIRVTVLLAGLQLEEAFIKAEAVDNIICASLPIAFDDTFGFLTESPMNLGTAMNCELLLHMPAMEVSGEIREISDSVSRIGFNIKGVTSQDGYNNSSVYKLSNQLTLGITERTAIENLNSIANQVVARERNARENIDVLLAEDSIFRAVAILKSARKIDINELEELLSKLKLGISLGIIQISDISLPHKLYIESMNGALQLKYGELHNDDLNFKRAEIVREIISGINI